MRHAVFIALTLTYPLALWLLQGRVEPRWLALLLVALAVARLVSTRQRTWVLVGAGAMMLAVLAGLLNVQWPLKLYPLVVNGSLLALFGATLVKGPSMVERLARLTEPELPTHAIEYTRKVTMVWCVFFMVNGAISAATAVWASDGTWALYNGGISYGLMGLLFAIEYGVRLVVRRRHEASR